MSDKEKFAAAYRATTYRVFLPGGALDLRADEADDRLRAWLAAGGFRSWAVLTACNPRSQRLAAAANAERQAALECALLEEGWEPYAGENVADANAWPAEESCLVPAIPLHAAMALARKFDQNAFLFGGTDAVPRLVWTEESGR